MQVSGKWIAGIVFVLLFCMAAGCMGSEGSTSPGSGISPFSSGGSGKSSSNSPGNFPQNSYFTFDCKGDWKSSTDLPWKNHHGSFTVTGNVPFPITYDYQVTGIGLYTATDTAGTGMSSPLQVQGESSYCSGTPDDCKPCHFIYDGDIYAGGMMVYNRSADASRKWTVVFTRMPGGEGIWHTRSVRQTGSGCDVTGPGAVEAVGPVEVLTPTYACFTDDKGSESGSPFSFSDGSGFEVSPHIDPSNTKFTNLDPRVVFHLGKAPS